VHIFSLVNGHITGFDWVKTKAAVFERLPVIRLVMSDLQRDALMQGSTQQSTLSLQYSQCFIRKPRV